MRVAAVEIYTRSSQIQEVGNQPWVFEKGVWGGGKYFLM